MLSTVGRLGVLRKELRFRLMADGQAMAIYIYLVYLYLYLHLNNIFIMWYYVLLCLIISAIFLGNWEDEDAMNLPSMKPCPRMLMASMIASMIQDVASTPSGLPCGWVPQHRMNCSISSWEIATYSSLFKQCSSSFCGELVPFSLPILAMLLCKLMRFTGLDRR